MPNRKELITNRLNIEIPARNDNPFEVVNNLSPTWGIMLTMQENLNLRIGTQIWKKYINATFWNYISTPINFTITLFSALSAGQTGTGSVYLTSSQLFYILFTTFVLSIANTFFNLKEKAKINYESAKIYESFGYDFEKIYFIPILCDDDLDLKLNYYRQLQEQIDSQSEKESIEYANYMTELIFIITKYCFCADFTFNKLSANERFWFLDGKDSTRYNNKYKVDMSIFKDDFNTKTHKDKVTHLQVKNGELNVELIKLKHKLKELEESPYLKFMNTMFSNINRWTTPNHLLKIENENKEVTGLTNSSTLTNTLIEDTKNINVETKEETDLVDSLGCLKGSNNNNINKDEEPEISNAIVCINNSESEIESEFEVD